MPELLSEQIHQQILCVREEERKQIARELHDQIIQALVGVNFHLSELKKYRRSDTETRIADIQSDLRTIIDDVRRICTRLRPPVLDSLGLIPAMRSTLREFECLSECRIVFLVRGDTERRLAESIELCIYRVFQEALTNVQKHAHARQIDVELEIGSEVVTLIVRDDGEGFCIPEHLNQFLLNKHFGLIGARERLDMIGGRLEIVSDIGKGTLFRAVINLASDI